MQRVTQQSPNRRKNLCKPWRTTMKDILRQNAFWTRLNILDAGNLGAGNITCDPWMQFIFEINYITPSKFCGHIVVGHVVQLDMCVFDMILVGTYIVTDWNVNHNVYLGAHSLGTWVWLVLGGGYTCPGRVDKLSLTCWEKRTSHNCSKIDNKVHNGQIWSTKSSWFA